MEEASQVSSILFQWSSLIDGSCTLYKSMVERIIAAYTQQQRMAQETVGMRPWNPIEVDQLKQLILRLMTRLIKMEDVGHCLWPTRVGNMNVKAYKDKFICKWKGNYCSGGWTNLMERGRIEMAGPLRQRPRHFELQSNGGSHRLSTFRWHGPST